MQAAQVISAVSHPPAGLPLDGTTPAPGGPAFAAEMEEGEAATPDLAVPAPDGSLVEGEAEVGTDLPGAKGVEATVQPVPMAPTLPSAVAVAIVVQSTAQGEGQAPLPGSFVEPGGDATLAAQVTPSGTDPTASGDAAPRDPTVGAQGAAPAPVRDLPASSSTPSSTPSAQPTGAGTVPGAADAQAAAQAQAEAPVAPTAAPTAATPSTGAALSAGPALPPGAAVVAGAPPAAPVRMPEARRDEGGRVPSSWSLLTQDAAGAADAHEPAPPLPVASASALTLMEGLPLGDLPAEPDSQPAAVATSAPAPAAPQTSATAPVATLPASVPADLVAVLRQQPDGPVEISLSPEELGRLRVSLWADSDGVRMVVQAERGETLDLLRRNADVLLAELQAEGFTGGRLDFASWGGDPRDPAPAQDEVEAQPSVAAASFPQTLPQNAASGSGLDLRL